MNVLKMLAANAIAASSLSLAFRSSATSLTASVTAPNDIVAGDLLVFYDVAVNTSGAPTSVVPSGFTSILNQVYTTTRRTICSFKIADGSEANTTITGMDGTGADTNILLVFSTNGAVSGTSFDVAFEDTSGNPIAQTVNASSGTSPLVVIAFMRQTNVTGQSFSPTQDGTVVISTSTAYYKIYNSSPSDVTVDCGDGGLANNTLMSFYIEVN